MMSLLDTIDRFMGNATEGYIYAICRNIENRDTHTTRDCPAGTLAILRDGKVYVRTGEHERDFWIFREDNRVWKARGALEG